MTHLVREHLGILKAYERLGLVDLYVKERKQLDAILKRNGIILKQEVKQQTLF